MAETLVLLFVLSAGGLDFTLVAKSEKLSAFENAIVSIRVVNSSTAALSYPTSQPMIDFKIGLRHADGRPLALTPIGERELRPFTSRWSPLKWGDEWPVPLRDARLLTLAPGEERIHDVWLGQWLEFERPGRYTVFIRGSSASSAVVSFEVAADWDKPLSAAPRENDSERRRRLALSALERDPGDRAAYEAIASVAAHAVDYGGPDAGTAAFAAWARRVGGAPEQLTAWQRQLAKDIVAIGFVTRGEARGLLRRALRSPHVWVRSAAARALSLQGDAGDASEVVRAGSVRAAVLFAHEGFLEALRSLAGVSADFREALAERERLRAAEAALGECWGTIRRDGRGGA